jgi:hypothetical protein
MGQHHFETSKYAKRGFLHDGQKPIFQRQTTTNFAASYEVQSRLRIIRCDIHIIFNFVHDNRARPFFDTLQAETCESCSTAQTSMLRSVLWVSSVDLLFSHAESAWLH